MLDGRRLQRRWRREDLDGGCDGRTGRSLLQRALVSAAREGGSCVTVKRGLLHVDRGLSLEMLESGRGEVGGESVYGGGDLLLRERLVFELKLGRLLQQVVVFDVLLEYRVPRLHRLHAERVEGADDRRDGVLIDDAVRGRRLRLERFLQGRIRQR